MITGNYPPSEPGSLRRHCHPLMPVEFAADQPRVGPGYAELMIPRRPGAGERDDLLLASWFGGGETSAADDQVFEILSGSGRAIRSGVIGIPPTNCKNCCRSFCEKTLGFAPRKRWKAFGLSLGGVEFKGSVWFGAQYGDREGSGIAAELWQILSVQFARSRGALIRSIGSFTPT